MATEVKLPQLGQTMEEGTIVNCLVKADDQVKKGDVIFEVETDKATLELESPADGFVKHILAENGQTLLVGEVVMILGEKDEQVAAPASGSTAPAAAVTPTETPAAAEAAKPEAVKPAAKPGGKVKASPRAKKLARDMGVDITAIAGTGPGGRVTEDDVKNTSSAKPADAAPVAEGDIKLGDAVPVNRLQKITAQRMMQSKLEIPCFYLTVKVDATELVDFRAKFNETSDVKVAYNDFIIRAVGMGIKKFPVMAGQSDGKTIKIAPSIGVGLAIAAPDGLVAPIVKDVQKKTPVQIARDTKILIDKTRNNKLAPADLSDGNITVSNLGAFGIESFIPIVVPGQASIIGVGRISDTCVPDNGNIMIRKMMSMTLSVDHKVANGAYAAQFLDFVRKTLETPANLA
ncbi:dihydrolipoamide acetyltransferase family protein [Planctomycetota bacterium]